MPTSTLEIEDRINLFTEILANTLKEDSPKLESKEEYLILSSDIT